jgi:porphobilinogen synthase
MFRMRRNRKSNLIRNLVSENELHIQDMILPVFVCEGHAIKEEIATMPGVYRYSIDQLVILVAQLDELHIHAIAVFPSVGENLKTDDAKEAYNSNNLICKAVKEVKKHSKILIICDVALDPYTTHGHDGLIIGDDVDNDATIEILVKQALTLANAGCDIVAPSDMMDGRILAIRSALDKNNFNYISILSYAAKFASNFYGPFRDAVKSNKKGIKISKATYQMDFRNSKESHKQIEIDIKSGADIIMIKPAMPYLDIIHSISQSINTPIFTYQVSGEYSMLKLLAQNSDINFEFLMYEALIAAKRAGASAILTYAAIDMAKFLRNVK